MDSFLGLDPFKVNYWIQIGCVGISTNVFLAWQYGLRDGSGPLADPAIWRGLDARLPRNAAARVTTFLNENFLLRPGDEQRTPWTLITSAFSHRDTGHFLANLLSFSSVCKSLTIVLPPVHLVGLILSTALGGSAGFLAQQSRGKFPNRRVRALGMSGITTGLGVALAVLWPNARVVLYGFPLPIWLGLAGYLAWDVLLLPSEISNIGHAAHIGGGITGLLYALSFRLLSGSDYAPHMFVRQAQQVLREGERIRQFLDSLRVPE